MRKYGLSYCLFFVGGMARAGEAPADQPAVIPDCIDTATENFQNREFVATASVAEACWQSTRHPRAQFLVAMSRLALHQDALALLALDRYLVAGTGQEPPRSLLMAQVKRDEARKRTVAVTLKISPPVAEGVDVEISAKRDGDATYTPVMVNARTLERDEHGPVLRLDPGSWTFVVKRPGYAPTRQRVELATSRPTHVVEVAMTRERAPAVVPSQPTPVPADVPPRPPPARPRKLMLGLAIGGGVMAAAGTGFIVSGSMRRAGLAVCDRPESDSLACKQDLATALRWRGAGAGVLGAGLGVITGALTWLAPDPTTRRKAWISEALVGGIALVGGAALLTVSSRRFNQANTSVVPDWSGHFDANIAGPHTAAAGVFGLGGGLVLGAVTGLLVQRGRTGRAGDVSRTLRLDTAAGPHRTMVLLSGRF